MKGGDICVLERKEMVGMVTDGGDNENAPI